MKRVGILTFHRAANYGAVLQAYALVSVLREQAGEDFAQIVDYRCRAIENTHSPWPSLKGNKVKAILRNIVMHKIKKRKKEAFDRFRSTWLVTSKRIYNRENIFEANAEFDAYITGSDQVFNLLITENDRTYLLDFADKSKRLFSYSASFGQLARYLEGEQENLPHIKRINRLSLREGIPLTEQNREIHKYWRVDIDPTLLMKKSDWVQLIVPPKCKKPYILIYTVQPQKRLIDFAKKLSAQTGNGILYLNDRYFSYIDIKHIRAQAPEVFLGYIANAAYVITTSFHGTVFALQFHRKIYVELNEGAERNERVEHLLSSLDLLDRAIDYEYTARPEDPIPWDEIDARIEQKRQYSLEYIKEIINDVESC